MCKLQKIPSKIGQNLRMLPEIDQLWTNLAQEVWKDPNHWKKCDKIEKIN